MRKLIESTFVSLDGVIDDTRPSTASRAEPQHWGSKYWDEQHAAQADGMLVGADTLLLGRVTFEGMAPAWSSRSGDFADRVNAMPKYVVSRTLAEASWNAQVIRDDVPEEIARIKEQPGANILKWGTGELDRTLVEHGLVDEFHFWYYPVILGAGKHLFEGAGFDTTHVKLADINRLDSGIVVHIYIPR